MNKEYIIVFGSSGTLGSELKWLLNSHNYEIISPSHSDVDVTDYAALSKFMYTQKNKNIKAVVNCSAVINTVGIETSFEIRNKSFSVNVIAVRNLARLCKELKFHFIHVSTDYVLSEFASDGNEFPVNIYGYHKLLSELYIQNTQGLEYTILRVGWIYGYKTRRTFIHKFISNVVNHLNEGKTEIECVSDQTSTPTSVKFISKKICDIINLKLLGLMSISPKGISTKYEFAKKILEICIEEYGFDQFKKIELVQSSTNQNNIAYPLNSAFQLNDLKHWVPTDITWQEDLLSYMTEYRYEFCNYIKDILR